MQKGGIMKKLIVVTIMVTLMMVGLPALNAQDAGKQSCEIGKLSLGIGGGMRNLSEQLYADVYDSPAITYNIDLGYKVWNNLEVFFHTDYFKKDGLTTLTKEDTTLTIIPLELGARYLIGIAKPGNCKMRLFPYIGAGAGYYMVKEENGMGTFDEKPIGFFIEGGFRFYPTGSFFIDAKLKNIFLESESDNDVSLGGFAYMGGIGISF
jgi:opacity protein-like surface antigen